MVRLEKNDPLMLARQLPIKSVALILAGGRGTRLKDLTIKRAKPAVHFGGKFRIIDFALSNCINSGIRRIGVITQYQSHTLVQHIQRGWSFFSEEMNEFVDLLPAQQRVHGENWYRGTADAVTQNLDIISRYKAEYVVILAGDHIYKQDYSRMLIDHVEKGARCTVACMPVPIEEASAFGVMAVDENEKIIAYNNYIKYLSEIDKPDIFVLGVPGGILPITRRQPEHFGIFAFEVFNSVKPDYMIFNLYNADVERKYLSEMKMLMKYRFDVDIDAFYISNYIQDGLSLNTFMPIKYIRQEQQDVEEKWEKFGEGIYYKSKITLLVENLIQTLNGYKEIEIL